MSVLVEPRTLSDQPLLAVDLLSDQATRGQRGHRPHDVHHDLPPREDAGRRLDIGEVRNPKSRAETIDVVDAVRLDVGENACRCTPCEHETHPLVVLGESPSRPYGIAHNRFRSDTPLDSSGVVDSGEFRPFRHPFHDWNITRGFAATPRGMLARNASGPCIGCDGYECDWRALRCAYPGARA